MKKNRFRQAVLYFCKNKIWQFFKHEEDEIILSYKKNVVKSCINHRVMDFLIISEASNCYAGFHLHRKEKLSITLVLQSYK